MWPETVDDDGREKYSRKRWPLNSTKIPAIESGRRSARHALQTARAPRPADGSRRAAPGGRGCPRARPRATARPVLLTGASAVDSSRSRCCFVRRVRSLVFNSQAWTTDSLEPALLRAPLAGLRLWLKRLWLWPH
jgi:hypothetical protein